MALNAFIYAVIVFVTLGVIALVVAAIMRLMYAIVHGNRKKVGTENKAESKTEPKAVSQ